VTDIPAGPATAQKPADPARQPAIACDMTDAPDTGPERLAEYARLFDSALISRERTPTAMRWWLRNDEGTEAWAKDLAARENACCAFMTTTVTAVGDRLLWESTAIDDPAAREVLDMMYELPERRWTDAGQAYARFTGEIGVPIVISDGPAARPATPGEVRGGRPRPI
jgi:hypothetical protein